MLLKNLILLIVVTLCIEASPVTSASSLEPEGVVFDVYDKDGGVRRSIDPRLSAHLIESLNESAPLRSDAEHTAFEAFSVISSRADKMVESRLLSKEELRDLASFMALVVLQLVAERHPAVAAGIIIAPPPSPIEEIRRCDRSGSRACGCMGACHSRMAKSCAAVNLELCILRSIMHSIDSIMGAAW
jgi:hypothetical protein